LAAKSRFRFVLTAALRMSGCARLRTLFAWVIPLVGASGDQVIRKGSNQLTVAVNSDGEASFNDLMRQPNLTHHPSAKSAVRSKTVPHPAPLPTPLPTPFCTWCQLDFNNLVGNPLKFREDFVTLPSHGFKYIFSKVCNAGGEDLDLIMTPQSNYTGAFRRNKVQSSDFELNVQQEGRVIFTFQLVKAGTGDPYKVTRVVFSVKGIDHFNNVPMGIIAPGHVKAAMGKGLERRQPGHLDAFQSVRSELPKDQILSLLYQDTSGWNVLFAVGGKGRGDRTFVLTGGTDLMPADSCCSVEI